MNNKIHNLSQQLQTQGERWLHPVAQSLGRVPPQQWRRGLLLLLVLWALYLVIKLGLLLFLDRDFSIATPDPTAVAQPVAADGAAVDIERLTGWHLFGEASAEAAATPVPEPAAGIEQEARETSLDLELLGLVYSDKPELSRAVIVHQRQQAQYAVGDALPVGGNVTLAKVLLDRVILDNNGTYEALWLYTDDDQGSRRGRDNYAQQTQPAAARRGPRDVTAGTEGLAQLAAGYRDRLGQRGRTLADAVRIAMTREGDQVVGYKVLPGRDREQFEKLGFESGDIITAVNDITLDDPRKALELYNLLRTSNSATFSIQRDGQPMSLTVTLE